jgi:signal transduction histidine kinase
MLVVKRIGSICFWGLCCWLGVWGFPSAIAQNNPKKESAALPDSIQLPPEIDSLRALLPIVRADSQKVLLYKDLCWQYRNVNLDSALRYGREGFELATRLQLKKEQADYCRKLGLVYWHFLYHTEAFDWYFKGLKISEEIGYQEGVAFSFDNIGVAFYAQNQHAKALGYFRKALAVFLKIKHSEGLAYVYTHLCWTYTALSNYTDALKFGHQALAIRRAAHDQLNISNTLRDLGVTYKVLGRYDSAKWYLIEAIQLAQTAKRELFVADHTLHLADLFLKTNQTNLALIHAQESYQIARLYHAKRLASKAAKIIGEVYLQQKDYKNAINYQAIHYQLQDSVTNEELTKATARIELEHSFQQRERELLLAQKNKDIAVEKQLARQQLYIYIAVIALLFLMVLTLLTYLGRRKQLVINQVLAQKNQAILEQGKVLQEQAEQLKEMNRLKDKLFSIISHDLRGPLNSVHAMINLSGKEQLSPEELQQMMPEVNKQLALTNNLVESLLLWAKSQFSGEPLSFEVFAPDDIIAEAIELFQAQISHKQITIRQLAARNASVYANKNAYSLIIRNLLANAIKFTQEKGLIVIDYQEADGQLITSIQDSGIGISPENMQALFGSNMLQRQGTAQEKGTGLGLIFAKEFAEKSGGAIWATSEQGRGTTFFFAFPQTKPPYSSAE